MPTSCYPHLRVILTLGLCLGLARPLPAAGAAKAAATPAPQAAPAGATAAARLAAQLQSEDNEEPGQRVTKPGARVAMIDFETVTLDENRVKALSQAFWARLEATPGLALFPRPATRRWLIRHDLFPFTPYMAPPPPHRVTGALKADYLLTGHLDQNPAGGGLIVDVSLFSDREKRYILKDLKQECGELDSLPAGFGGLAAQVSKAIAASETGSLKPGEAPAIDHAAKPAQATPLPPSRAQGKAKVKSGAAIKKAGPGRKSGRKTVLTPAPQKAAARANRPETDEEPHGAAKAEKAPAAAPAPAPTPTVKSPSPSLSTSQSLSHSPAAPGKGRVGSETRPTATPTPTPTATPKPAPTPAPRAVAGQHEIEAQQQLALECYNQKRYEECIAQCDKAIQDTPESSMLLTIKGSALIELARYSEAAKAHEAALRLDPQNLWAAYNLALALTWARSERAAGTWRDFLAMAEKNPEQQELVRQAREHLAKLAPAASPAAAGAPAAAPTKAAPQATPTPAPRAKAGAKH